MVKNYVFAGIDLIINKQGEIYFIEANSSPGALKEYCKAYKHCKPVVELCAFLNKKYKNMAVISKKKWEESIISKKFQKEFNGNIFVCDYLKNKDLMLEGDGSLIERHGKKITPDVILRVAAGRPYAQEKAGIKIINSTSVLNITQDKIKAKLLIKENTKIKVPQFFIINKKEDIKKILEKNKELFSKGFILKPLKGQKSRGVFVFYSYEEISEDFKIEESYIMEELIRSSDLFKDEFFEIRSMAVNGKYVGSMLFVSAKRPMHLFKEGRTEKTPKKLENNIKKATEQIVKVLDEFASK